MATLVVVLAVALGALVRSTAGGVGIGLALVLVVPPLLAADGRRLTQQLSEVLPALRVGEDAFLAGRRRWTAGLAVAGVWAVGAWAARRGPARAPGRLARHAPPAGSRSMSSGGRQSSWRTRPSGALRVGRRGRRAGRETRIRRRRTSPSGGRPPPRPSEATSSARSRDRGRPVASSAPRLVRARGSGEGAATTAGSVVERRSGAAGGRCRTATQPLAGVRLVGGPVRRLARLSTISVPPPPFPLRHASRATRRRTSRRATSSRRGARDRTRQFSHAPDLAGADRSGRHVGPERLAT